MVLLKSSNNIPHEDSAARMCWKSYELLQISILKATAEAELPAVSHW